MFSIYSKRTISQRISQSPRRMKAVGAAIFTAVLVASGAGIANAATPGHDGIDVVATASKWKGTPYVYGGNSPTRGLDCSGLVQQAFARNGKKLPRTSSAQARVGSSVNGLKNAKPGDVLAFGSPASHVAIYLGNGKMLHAPHTGDVVKIAKVYKTPSSIRRMLPADDHKASAPSRGGSNGASKRVDNAIKSSSSKSSGTISGNIDRGSKQDSQKQDSSKQSSDKPKSAHELHVEHLKNTGQPVPAKSSGSMSGSIDRKPASSPPTTKKPAASSSSSTVKSDSTSAKKTTSTTLSAHQLHVLHVQHVSGK